MTYVCVYLQRSSCCYVCNGYYGSCFDEQVCQTCHLFLFSEELTQSVQENVVHSTMVMNLNLLIKIYVLQTILNV